MLGDKNQITDPSNVGALRIDWLYFRRHDAKLHLHCEFWGSATLWPYQASSPLRILVLSHAVTVFQAQLMFIKRVQVLTTIWTTCSHICTGPKCGAFRLVRSVMWSCRKLHATLEYLKCSNALIWSPLNLRSLTFPLIKSPSQAWIIMLILQVQVISNDPCQSAG